MRLSTRCDIQAPLDFTYRCLTDFEAWEHLANRRNTEVERPQGTPLEGVGAAWRLRFRFRSKTRKVLLTLTDLVQDKEIGFTLDSPLLEGEAEVELQRMTLRHTRMRVAVTLRPKTLAARLMLNTARLAKGRIAARLDMRLEQLSADIEARHQRSELMQRS